MNLFPAIDLRDGKVVRLTQGDYDRMTVYGENPCAQARQFVEAGARYLHVVDLDGAKDGTLSNYGSIAALAEQGGLYIEVERVPSFAPSRSTTWRYLAPEMCIRDSLQPARLRQLRFPRVPNVQGGPAYRCPGQQLRLCLL